MTKSVRILVGGSVVAATLTIGAGLGAQSMVTPIGQRQAVMRSMGAHLGGIKASLKSGDTKTIMAHARAVNGFAKIIPSLFPAGSGAKMGKTRAKPAIWSNMNGFTGAAKKLETESGKLIAAAKGGNMKAIGAQFGAMAKTACGGCHKTFRGPKVK